ncbi:MAG: hypothetical protein R2774_00355 [Saprospiraceae bacterium]
MDIQEKLIYTEWANNEAKLPIFFRPWYLDKVCTHGEWHVILSLDGENKIEGVLVYYLTSKKFQKVIIMPPLIPYLGIWIPSLRNEKATYKLRKETNIIRNLISKIPKDVTLYRQSYLTEFENWLPFHWARFNQTTRYTLTIENLSTWSIHDVATNVRNKINKAQKSLQIELNCLPEIVYQQTKSIMKEKNIDIVWPKELFLSLDQELSLRNKRLIIAAKDNTNQIHASSYIVIDNGTAYMLILGSDKNLRKSGAIPFVIYHSILEASKYVNKFDFEGSMLESLFDLFSGFGGKLTPYLSIYKTKNGFWEIIYNLKTLYDNNNR